MLLGEFNNYSFNGTSQYLLNEQNYILAVREDSYQSDRIILPLFYKGQDELILEIDEEEVGKRILVYTSIQDRVEDISTRFHLNELFKLYSAKGLVPNKKWEDNKSLPKYGVYRSNLQELAINEVIEIFEGHIDAKNSRVIIENALLNDLIIRKYAGTDQVFFCLENANIIGPFKVKRSDDSGYLEVIKSPVYKFGVYDIKQDNIVEIVANDINRKIIADNLEISNSFIDEYDFISDADLINWFGGELANQPEQFIQTNELELVIKEIEKANIAAGFIDQKDRFDRVSSILANTKDLLISKNNLLNVIPKYQGIQEEIEQLENKNLELKNSINENERVNEQMLARKGEIEKEEAELANKISDLKEQAEIEENKIREKIQKEISILEQKKELLHIEIETEREQKSTELERIIRDVEYHDRRRADLVTGIEALRKEFTAEQRNAHEILSELVKQNTHFNFISGRDLPLDNDTSVSYPDFNVSTPIIDYKKLRDGLQEILKKQNRIFENHFVDNLLICIHQNTLTLFAGLPGTGKTSLANMLTLALTPPSRVKEIPVSRGWTSQKDLIGFSNPLSKKFHESQTGLYSLLKQLDYEWNSSTYLTSPMSYVILDEANLSPVEHYWSVFYNLTDKISSKNNPIQINLGQSEIIRFSNSLRFIGTINYDQTTEDLSPRILDRTNIIRLMPNKFVSESLTHQEIQHLSIDFNSIINLFKLNDFKTEISQVLMPEKLQQKYNDIKNIFTQKLNIYISPRLDLSIMRYCQLAITLMTEENRPLDYCIAQRLLPLINIHGNKKNELEELLMIIQSFNLTESISENILKNIIEIGSRTGYTQDNYNYFLTLTHV